MCAQDELERLKKKNTLLKQQLKRIEGQPEVIDEETTILRRKIEQERVTVNKYWWIKLFPFHKQESMEMSTMNF